VERKELLDQVRRQMRELANPARAQVSLRYFKTAPGEYGAGDQFIGNTVPDLRKIAKQYRDLPVSLVLRLLHSPIHEERVLALLILNSQFQRGSESQQRQIHHIYLKNMKWINNWDLVDCSAPLLIGEHLIDKETTLLDQLALDRNLWKRRTAIVATLAFIKRNRLDITFRIAEALIPDREDLIHKATGWMLREAGKRDSKSLERFLKRNASRMPRTMLRYAVERFSESKRLRYLATSSTRARVLSI
jgi:3-methyladenine DNA glycosylase AlkD